MPRAKSLRSVVLLTTMAMLIGATMLFWSHIRYPYSLHADVSSYPYRWKTVIDNEDLANHGVDSPGIAPSLYNVSVPYDDANFECVKTVTRPSISVCLFNVWHDVLISRSLQSDGIWEPYVVNEYIEAVERSDTNAGV